MAQVVTFEDYRPIERYDGLPWESARIEELQGDLYTQIDLITLDPIDADPTNPQRRNLTTANASDDGIWYRVVFVDAAGAESVTEGVSRGVTEALSETALCTDEDVRIYLGRAPSEIEPEDRSTIIRLVNAASDAFTQESQRVWKLSGAGNPRVYRVEKYDIDVGRLRIDDCTAIDWVSVYDYRDVTLGGNTPVDPASYYGWQEFADEPITAIVFMEGFAWLLGQVVAVRGAWGWPAVPEKVRQAVIYTAAEWFARDVEKFSATFSVEQGTILLPQMLPSQVQRIAESYRRWRVA